MVTGSVTIVEVDMKTLKEANTEMDMDIEMAAMGPLALYHWKTVVVLMHMGFQEGRLEY